MCDFISWVEKDGAVLYLTGKDLKTSRGKAMRARIGDDVCGHGAIREYFDILPGVGVEKECTDFSSPLNFPAQIVADIKAGLFRGVGFDCALLSGPAWAEYDKVCATAWAEYDKVRATAWAEYDKVVQRTFWTLFADNSNRAEAWK
jgi:hypothetical protein